MKKILTTLALVSAAVYVQAQGTIELQNNVSTYLISTNNGAAGSLLASGNVGRTTTTANSFYYALLTDTGAAIGTAPADNPLSGVWSGAEVTGVNFGVTSGGILGQGGGTGSATPAGTWAAPTSAQITGGTEQYFIVVGWSANLGSTWSTVSGELANNWSGFTTGQGVFGYSAVGYSYAGGGTYSVGAPSIWGVSAAAPGGLTSGFTLNGITVPEPSTIALGAMGALSLLALRRKKA